MQTLLDHKVYRDAGPLENVFILVDDELFGSMITAGYRAIPFFERDGYYEMDTIWGPPPDDTTTIRELERLRWSGATFIVFVWSAF